MQDANAQDQPPVGTDMTTVLHPESLTSQLTSTADKAVRKRDGRTADWDPERIVRAIALAFFAARNKGADNPNRDNQAKHTA